MVRLTRIYTRTGDKGETRLADGSAVRKTDLRVAAYGAIDELNACLGLVRLHTAGDGELDSATLRIQNDLFDLGADLATPPGVEGALRVTPGQTRRLETEIDAINKDLSPLESFVLPGGSAAAAALHLARTVCRRAERAVVALADAEPHAVSGPAMTYVNRLSDLLFVAARRANRQGADDVLWKPGATRDDSA